MICCGLVRKAHAATPPKTAAAAMKAYANGCGAERGRGTTLSSISTCSLGGGAASAIGAGATDGAGAGATTRGTIIAGALSAGGCTGAAASGLCGRRLDEAARSVKARGARVDRRGCGQDDRCRIGDDGWAQGVGASTGAGACGDFRRCDHSGAATTGAARPRHVRATARMRRSGRRMRCMRGDFGRRVRDDGRVHATAGVCGATAGACGATAGGMRCSDDRRMRCDDRRVRCAEACGATAGGCGADRQADARTTDACGATAGAVAQADRCGRRVRRWAPGLARAAAGPPRDPWGRGREAAPGTHRVPRARQAAGRCRTWRAPQGAAPCPTQRPGLGRARARAGSSRPARRCARRPAPT
jgi:hypothetical protein